MTLTTFFAVVGLIGLVAFIGTVIYFHHKDMMLKGNWRWKHKWAALANENIRRVIRNKDRLGGFCYVKFIHNMNNWFKQPKNALKWGLEL